MRLLLGLRRAFRPRNARPAYSFSCPKPLLVTGLLLSKLVGLTAHGQQRALGAPGDSARLVVLPAARVTAPPPGWFAAGASFTALDSAALRPTGSLADALALSTPLYVKQTGPGQLASLSIRGTAARHVAVLWHGFTLNYPTLGEPDFALLPTAGFQSATLRRGPAGAPYGTGAMGGAVVLDNALTGPPGVSAVADLTTGSFGLRAERLEGTYRTNRVSSRTVLFERRATNDFPYNPPGYAAGTVRRQVNAAQQQQSITQDVAVRLGPRTELTAAAWLTWADRRIQPTLEAANDHARQQDASQRLLLAGVRSGAHTTATVRVAWLADQLAYASDAVSRSASRSRSWQVQAEEVVVISPTLTLEAGAEAQRFAADVTDYGPAPVTEYRAAAYAAARYTPTARLLLTANLRLARLPGRRPPPLPTLGAEWVLLKAGSHQLRLTGQAARAYRAPTLNERYWRPGGNPNLLPENGLGYEAGLRYAHQTPHWQATASLTAYRLLVTDWVQWVPTRPTGAWSPRNLRQVRSRGLEAEAQATHSGPAGTVSAHLGYALTQAEKTRGYATDPDPAGHQLAYVPRHSATLGLAGARRRWRLALDGSLTSFRYVSASATDFLPGYGLLHTSLTHTRPAGPLSLTFSLRGFNLTNTAYQTLEGRLMPGRAAEVGLRVAWR